jgi:hypothetical protein
VDDGSYDRVEQIRAERAHQQALDQATAGLPPASAQQVQAAARVVTQAQQGVADPGERARRTAAAVEQQAAQFKDDPAASRAFVAAISPQLSSVGRDLGDASKPDAGPAIASLSRACDSLGDGASLDLGRQVAFGLPDHGDLSNVTHALGEAGFDSTGGRRLLFAVAKGLEDQGKGASADALRLPLRQVAMLSVQPGEVVQPVDPKSPDALGQAQMKLLYARALPSEFAGPEEPYATALQSQLGAFQGDPAARQALALSQTGNIEALAQRASLDGPTLRIALDAAQAAGPAELDKVAASYAAQLGPTRLDLQGVAQSVSPQAATALAFAFAKVGNTADAGLFAGRAADMLHGVASTAKEANDKLASLQGTLDTELTQVGPALTPTQRADYEARFWDQHQHEVQAARDANAALQAGLTADLPTLKALAPLDPKVGDSVAEVLGQLARDPAHAQETRTTIEGLRGPGGAFVSGFGSAEASLGTAYVTAAQVQASGEIARGQTSAALSTLKATSTFLKNVNWGTFKMQDFVQKGLPTLDQFTAAVGKAVQARDLTPITDFLATDGAKKLDAASGLGGDLGKNFGRMVKGVGMAAYLMEAAQAPRERDRVMALMKGSASGAELLADGFKTLAGATRDASSQVLRDGSAALKDFGGMLSKVAGAVTFGVSVVQDAFSLGDAFSNPNVKTVGTAIGDTLGAVGAGVALLGPGGAVVGAALNFAGAGISLLSGLIQGRIDDDHRKDEMRGLLEKVLADTTSLSPADRASAASRLARTEANLQAVQQDAGLTPEQLVQLAVQQPALDGMYGWELDQVAKYSGLQGQAFVAWASGLGDRPLQQWQSGVVTELRQGVERNAGRIANEQAMRAHDFDGKDFATVYAQVYQQELEKEMKDMLRGQGMIP